MEHQLDSIINKYINEGYFPSVVCRVFNNEKTFYYKAFGDVNINTIFDVASLTKIITTTEILMLINEGKIELEGKIPNYLPIINDFNVLRYRLKDVTVKQLLTHNSGIIDWHPFYSEEGSFYEVLNKVIGKYDIVKGTLYSDLNFMLLGEVIKKIAGLSLEESLEKYIKIPLNIKNIYYCPTNKDNIAPTSFGNIIEENMCRERNIEFKEWRNKEEAFIGEVNDGNSYYFFNGTAGHAGIFADVDAYTELCKFYMSNENEIIKSSMIEHADGRGLGWQISDIFPSGCGHTGFTGTTAWISIEKNVGAVIFTNRLYTKNETKNLNSFRKEIHNCILNYFK